MGSVNFKNLLIFLVIFFIGNVSSKKPNFVIMLMDDMGWGDLGCYGNPAEETPNLDKMAQEGIRFTDFYTGSAICSPSRASLMTGRLPIRNGFYSTNVKAKNSYTPQDIMGGISSSEVLIPEILERYGYYNKITGKWHLGHLPEHLPLKRGFHEWFGAPNCHYKYDDLVMPNIPVYKNDEMVGRYYDDFHIDHETGVGNLTQIYIEEALEFIEARSKEETPFFLYWAPDATHTPLYASDMFRGKSSRGLYGDAVMEIDYGVGRIMAKLQELDIDDNTFMFFSSDNGAATYAHTDGGSNGPFLCGKQTTFEGGFRQPALARYPLGIRPGQVSHQVGNLMDLLPTMLELADIPKPSHIYYDGLSLASHMINQTKFERTTFYYRGDTLFKVRLGYYKAHLYTWGTPKDAQLIDYHYCPGQYVQNLTTEYMEDYTKEPILIHLGRDPGEKFPIASESDEYKEIIEDVFEAIKEHVKDLEKGEPQLNWCDLSVQNWAPKGCEKIDRCMDAPTSYPYKCDWPY